MSLVALLVSDLGPQSTKGASLLMKAFGVGAGAIKAAAVNRSPLITKRLFDRADPLFASKLVSVLEQLDELGCEWTAIELPDGQVYSPTHKYYEITPDRLRNMIKAREESLEYQRRLGESEG